jgi:hypothetical protein
LSRIQYFVAAFILLGTLLILGLFVVVPKSGPFEDGTTPTIRH